MPPFWSKYFNRWVVDSQSIPPHLNPQNAAAVYITLSIWLDSERMGDLTFHRMSVDRG